MRARLEPITCKVDDRVGLVNLVVAIVEHFALHRRLSASEGRGHVDELLFKLELFTSVHDWLRNFAKTFLEDGLLPIEIEILGSEGVNQVLFVDVFVPHPDIQPGVPVPHQLNEFVRVSGDRTIVDEVRLAEIGHQSKQMVHIVEWRVSKAEHRFACAAHRKQGADSDRVRLFGEPPHQRQYLLGELRVLFRHQVTHNSRQHVGRI